MKTLNFKKIIIGAIAAIVVLSFCFMAYAHIVELTRAGRIDWRN